MDQRRYVRTCCEAPLRRPPYAVVPRAAQRLHGRGLLRCCARLAQRTRAERRAGRLSGLRAQRHARRPPRALCAGRSPPGWPATMARRSLAALLACSAVHAATAYAALPAAAARRGLAALLACSALHAAVAYAPLPPHKPPHPPHPFNPPIPFATAIRCERGAGPSESRSPQRWLTALVRLAVARAARPFATRPWAKVARQRSPSTG